MSQDGGASSAESSHTKVSSGTDVSVSITTVTWPFKILYLRLLYSAVCFIIAQVFCFILLVKGRINNQKKPRRK